jgi:hypothetical protein
MGLETHCCVSRPQVCFFLLSVMTVLDHRHTHILPGPDDASHVVWAVCMFLIVFCFSITNWLFPNDSAGQLSHPPFARIVGSHVSLRQQDREKKGGDEDIRDPTTKLCFVFGPQVSIFCFVFYLFYWLFTGRWYCKHWHPYNPPPSLYQHPVNLLV